MDPAIKAQKIEDVKKAISSIKNSQKFIPSFRTCEFCTNVSMLVADLQFDKIDKIKSWIQIYDIQGNMTLLIETILNPTHLANAEYDVFKDEIKVIVDFVEYAREYVK